MSESAPPPQPGDVRATVSKLWLDIVPGGEAMSFTEAGGDSLSGLRLLGAIYKATGVRIDWQDLDSAACAEDFADLVAARTARPPQ